jgi:acetyl esterase/lipase
MLLRLHVESPRRAGGRHYRSVLVRQRTTIRYGPHRSNVGDLWLPAEGASRAPVVVLIHGGFWRAVYTKRLMNGLAKAVVKRGWAAWNIEYRRLGFLGGGGGWPHTLDDVAAAIDHIAVIDGAVDPTRVVTCGHSAGGQLALWAAARGRLPAESPGDHVVVKVRGAVSLAGVVDLEEADRLGLGSDATAHFLGGHWEQREERYRCSSPMTLLPIGVPQVLVHGTNDTVVPPSMSENYENQATQHGDAARYIPVDGVGHRELIDPRGIGWATAAAELQHLVG